MGSTTKTLFILSPAFPADETPEQSHWLSTKQVLIQSINRCFPTLEIIIFVFHYPQKKGIYLWHGNKVISFGGATTTKFQKLFLWAKVFCKLVMSKRNKNLIGVISFWCSDCCLVGSYFSKIFRYKHLCWISGQDAKKENRLVKFIRPKANELVAMSNFLQEEFHQNHHIFPQYFIPNGIDPTMFPEGKVTKTIDILGAGGLIPLKQYHIFVEVVAAIVTKYPTLQVTLCGNGPEEKNIIAQIAQLKLQHTIQLTGLQPHETVLGLMKKAKIFLHTANYEGFGVVNIEALYAGAHVISFVQPINKSIEHWHIVSTKEEMIEKVLELLGSNQTEYTSVLPFNMDDSAKTFIDLLESDN